MRNTNRPTRLRVHLLRPRRSVATFLFGCSGSFCHFGCHLKAIVASRNHYVGSEGAYNYCWRFYWSRAFAVWARHACCRAADLSSINCRVLQLRARLERDLTTENDAGVRLQIGILIQGSLTYPFISTSPFLVTIELQRTSTNQRLYRISFVQPSSGQTLLKAAVYHVASDGVAVYDTSVDSRRSPRATRSS